MASTSREIQDIVAGVSSAKLLLSLATLIAALVAYLLVPLFREHPLLLWIAVLSEIVKAFLPIYYFYGTHHVALASILDISARMAAAVGIFIFVHSPADAWKFFALQGAGATIALFVGHAIIHVRHKLRWPRLSEGWRMLREGGPMFLFRSAHNIYVLGNAFILGLFATPQAVGYYAGAEKINSAAVGLLSPLTTALYPRAAELIKHSLSKAARLTTVSFYVMAAVSVVLGLTLRTGRVTRDDLGPGGRDMTRITGSSPEMWTAIAVANGGEIERALAVAEREIAVLRQALRGKDRAELRHRFGEAKKWFAGSTCRATEKGD